jgi:hypothetical protein
MIASLLSKSITLKINSHAQLHEFDLVLYLSFGKGWNIKFQAK